MRSRNKYCVIMVLGILALTEATTACIPLKITYIGSAGYMLESPTKKILIDAPFADMVKQFGVPVASPITQAMIAKGEAPFDEIDLILITHSHPGHYEPLTLVDNLKNNPNTQLVTNSSTTDVLAGLVPDYDLIEDRIHGIVLEEDYRTTDVNVGGLEIHISRSPHWTRAGTTDEGYLFNYSFNLDGIEIAYVLSEENYVVSKEIDILFGDKMTSNLQPKHIVLCHQSGHTAIANLAREASVIPEVTFLTNSMQKALLIKHYDGATSEYDVGNFILEFFRNNGL